MYNKILTLFKKAPLRKKKLEVKESIDISAIWIEKKYKYFSIKLNYTDSGCYFIWINDENGDYYFEIELLRNGYNLNFDGNEDKSKYFKSFESITKYLNEELDNENKEENSTNIFEILKTSGQ